VKFNLNLHVTEYLGITKFKEEFAAIRHGDYFNFINRVNEPLPFMVTYQSGQVYVDDKNNPDDIDFAGLLKAENSLKLFYENCIDHYGEIIDRFKLMPANQFSVN
jgi:hypothetical protein